MMSFHGNVFFALLALYEGNPPVTGGFPSQRPKMQHFCIFIVVIRKKNVEQTVELSRRLKVRVTSLQRTIQASVRIYTDRTGGLGLPEVPVPHKKQRPSDWRRLNIDPTRKWRIDVESTAMLWHLLSGRVSSDTALTTPKVFSAIRFYLCDVWWHSKIFNQ